MPGIAQSSLCSAKKHEKCHGTWADGDTKCGCHCHPGVAGLWPGCLQGKHSDCKYGPKDAPCLCTCHKKEIEYMSTAVQDAPTAEVPKAALQCYKCLVDLCEVCGTCETQGCIFFGKTITSKADLVANKALTATTQKARGYTVIAEHLNVPRPFRVISDVEEVETVLQRLTLPKVGLFARPCPVRPRHGFVDSRPLKNKDNIAYLTKEVKGILEEAKAADPDAELLLVPLVKATHNVILTPTRMAIGKGNDGATAGHQSVVFPLIGVQFLELTSQILSSSGVNVAEEDPYVEAVIRNNGRTGYAQARPTTEVYFTQLRAGAKIPADVDLDFVPDRFVVEKVVEASGDLLEWERQVKNEIKPGTAVYHLGGTLVSHYGVHCVFHNIPILTTRKPEVGEELIPTKRPERPTPEAVIEGLALGVAPNYIGLLLGQEHGVDVEGKWLAPIYVNQAASVLLAASHNAVAMAGDHGRWLGIAASLMMRLGMAASHGEARHKPNGDESSERHSRGFVYKMALNDFFNARYTLGCAQWRFKNLSWSSSYGGPKWAACTDSILRLDRTAKELIKDPTDKNVTALVTALHNAINQAHNGGWWLNKFVIKQVFDDACTQSMTSLCAAAPGILSIAHMDVNKAEVQEVLNQWLAEPDPPIEKGLTVSEEKLEIAQPTVDEASMEGASTVPFDEKCGDKGCTVCYPKPVVVTTTASPGYLGALAMPKKPKLPKEPATDKGNVNGITPYPADMEITSAQGQSSEGEIHVQFRAKGVKGYYSFNLDLPKTMSMEEQQKCNEARVLPSYSGSGNTYYPLTTHRDPDVPTHWWFTNESLGIKFSKELK